MNFSRGTVYVYNGQTYVVKYDSYLSVGGASTYAENPDGVYFLQEFDPTTFIDSSSRSSQSGWSPSLMNGTVFYEKARPMSFLGADYTRWETLPTQGGQLGHADLNKYYYRTAKARDRGAGFLRRHLSL
jgi:hypothetical protein